MELVTRFETVTRSTADLRGLLKKAFAARASAPASSQERRDALTSIHNIKIELARRPPCL
ncbi:MAG TPA: hypothetical protein VNS12_11700 [Pelagibacterium sp.]|uniref:hypothetical protein n=1 Tax=Pelagibacterium sp. TaxID=1967288 RepID=UPI002B8AE7E1|nr:hypothetical protein [Pelagibacterium sp.]HWJ88728.1 hypothetical protein [Pelagibacterium sp.]